MKSETVVVIVDEHTCDQVLTGAVLQLDDDQICDQVPAGALQQVDEQTCNTGSPVI